MKVPNPVHAAHPWVIAQIAPDFDLLDAWALPVEGSQEEFGDFLEVMATLDPTKAGAPSTFLFWVRRRLGDVLGWDDATTQHPIPGRAETTLAERLPDELRGSGDHPAMHVAQVVGAGFVPLYRTDEDWAAEISNDTVHGVLQLCWIEEEQGRYRGRLAVYVKARGTLGNAYMKLIEPFRHLIVYPALVKHIGRAWAERESATVRR